MNDTRIAVLIVTYNRLALLRECVDAVMGQTHAASALYIVDNKSTDGTGDYLAELARHPERSEGSFHIITSDKNLGGAGGFELGVSEALKYDDHDLLVLIDDDAMLAPDYLERMADAAEKHPDIAMFAGAVHCDDAVDTNHRRRIKNRLIFSEGWVPGDEYGAGRSFFCDMATFCGLVIRRDIIKKAGTPRGDFFIWYDDTEYCLRCGREAAKMDFSDKILVPSDAVIDHRSVPVDPEGDLLMRTDWRSFYGWRNRYYVAREYLGGLTALVVKCEYRVLGIKSRIMSHSADEKTRMQGRFNVKMIADVMRDIRSGRFGAREDYQRDRSDRL